MSFIEMQDETFWTNEETLTELGDQTYFRTILILNSSIVCIKGEKEQSGIWASLKNKVIIPIAWKGTEDPTLLSGNIGQSKTTKYWFSGE